MAKTFRCIGIVETYRNPSLSWCVKMSVALYEARPRQKDGVYTWRRIQLLGTPRWASAWRHLDKEAKRFAKNRRIKVDRHVRHGQFVGLSEIELLAGTC